MSTATPDAKETELEVPDPAQPDDTAAFPVLLLSPRAGKPEI